MFDQRLADTTGLNKRFTASGEKTLDDEMSESSLVRHEKFYIFSAKPHTHKQRGLLGFL